MTPCIGWPAPNGCPRWGGHYHGCRLPDNHRDTHHVCACGARSKGRTGQRREEAA